MCFSLARHSCVLCRVKWTSGLRAVYSPIAIILSHRRITSRAHFSLLFWFNTRLLPNFSSPWDLCGSSQPRLHLPSLYTLSCISPCQVFAVFQWWNVFLLLPSLSHRCLCLSAWGLWDCGRAALPWQRAVLPNCVHLGFGVSLRSLPLSYLFHLFSQVFFGVAEAISTPLSLSFSQSPQPITLKSTLTYVMRHIYLKTKFMSIPVPVPLSLPSSFHLLISLSL